ncbi:epoxide hydrolase A [Trifolium repens]|nr:epoxide hydrolase A [Trifolium repens]
MDKIQHKFVNVGALKLHIAEIGKGPNIAVFLHGFPEIWYSWRHQMIALAGAGFRAIAPDYRGYGLSDPPLEPEKTTFSHLLNDLLAILDALSLSKPQFHTHTCVSCWKRFCHFGASPAYLFSILHPERILGVITLGVPYAPPGPGPSMLHKYLPEGFYMLRWKEPGRAEADFGRFDAKTVVRNEIMDLVEPDTPLPSWFTEEDLSIYGALYEKSGFRTALQVPYRTVGDDLKLPDSVVKT